MAEVQCAVASSCGRQGNSSAAAEICAAQPSSKHHERLRFVPLEPHLASTYCRASFNVRMLQSACALDAPEPNIIQGPLAHLERPCTAPLVRSRAPPRQHRLQRVLHALQPGVHLGQGRLGAQPLLCQAVLHSPVHLGHHTLLQAVKPLLQGHFERSAWVLATDACAPPAGCQALLQEHM